MTLIGLRALLKYENKNWKAGIRWLAFPSQLCSATRFSGTKDDKLKQSGLKIVSCWYCERRNPIQDECRLRLRSDRDWSLKSSKCNKELSGNHPFTQGNKWGQQRLARDRLIDRRDNEQHSAPYARGFLTNSDNRKWYHGQIAATNTWLDFRKNSCYISKQSFLENYGTLEQTFVNKCAGKDTITGQDDATFVPRGTKIKLKCKREPKFEENLVALSKLTNRLAVNFTSAEKINRYEIINRETEKKALSVKY